MDLFNSFTVLAYGTGSSSIDSDGVRSVIGWIIIFVLFLAYYVSLTYNLYKLGVKMGYDRPWFAFIPFLNVVMIYELGDIPPWLIVIVIFPSLGALVVNILEIVAFYKIAEKNGKNPALAFLILVPIANLFIFKFIAPDDDFVPTEKKSDTVDKVLNE